MKSHQRKKLTPAERHASRSKPGTFTTEKREEFLQHYSQGGTVAACARKVGVSKVTVFNHVRTDKEFADRYRLALELNLDSIEDSITQLACKGNLTAMFGVLRAKRPNVWRESYGMKLEAGDGFAAAFAAAMKETLGGCAPATPDGSRQAVH